MVFKIVIVWVFGEFVCEFVCVVVYLVYCDGNVIVCVLNYRFNILL